MVALQVCPRSFAGGVMLWPEAARPRPFPFRHTTSTARTQRLFFTASNLSLSLFVSSSQQLNFHCLIDDRPMILSLSIKAGRLWDCLDVTMYETCTAEL